MGTFVKYPQDEFSPEYGEVKWKPRLNNVLEEKEVELDPIGYVEDGGPTMQITQENTVIYINQTADELDCVTVNYEPDGEGIWTWYFRSKFESDDKFAEVVGIIGTWATQIITLYPLPHVVKQYENFVDAEIPDSLPEDFGV